ncbi:MAG: hypothetical protein GY838_13605 [bacterium]|nr:hypothetical protein [bacterium]
MKAMIALLALASMMVVASGFIGFSGGGRSVAIEGGVDPPDTLDTTLWFSDSTNTMYRFYSNQALWMDEGEWIQFSHINAAHAGFLKFGDRVVSDTTTGAPDGFWRKDSSVVSEIRWMSERNGAAAACTLDVFTNRNAGGPVLAITKIVGPYQEDSTGVGLVLPDSVRISAATRAMGANEPDAPVLRLRVHKFRRP